MFFAFLEVGDLRTLVQFQGSEMSLGLFQDFMVFVPSFTQGNEAAGSVQDRFFPGVTQGNEDAGSVQD